MGFLNVLLKRGIICFAPFVIIVIVAQMYGLYGTPIYWRIGLGALAGYTIWYWIYILLVAPRLMEKYGGEW